MRWPREDNLSNLIILDDLVKNREEASSKTHKERVKDFYREDCYSRLEPDGAIIICNTRWSEDDIIAELKVAVTSASFSQEGVPFF